ncbi:uncharacterized protein AMSG_11731 [Thecamonas trahens ATCC 50062]|uniref:Uncharacterized protein n=1 Tax=Thecamonas trahens ATCC 50062 TaxID=461836 RepID=A0A0L0D1L5_THETB|nr:hypothetical protein AMSG_11731 [Thecamonas trahens ATCC 50062]KNC46249.1 hypothetical protein AMSG_11731 [Thecamonas trahens ATCC 50062]|eukprot:XP_013760754.1 hypothetical protein AMSG_11731 [Thecamonas trahens ATCC 50062]
MSEPSVRERVAMMIAPCGRRVTRSRPAARPMTTTTSRAGLTPGTPATTERPAPKSSPGRRVVPRVPGPMPFARTLTPLIEPSTLRKRTKTLPVAPLRAGAPTRRSGTESPSRSPGPAMPSQTGRARARGGR